MGEGSSNHHILALNRKVAYEYIETAKKAVAQYDGMDMGMGSALELSSV